MRCASKFTWCCSDVINTAFLRTTCAVVTFRKLVRKSSFAQAGAVCACELCMYVRWTPVEIQTSAHWDLIDSSMTAPTPVVIAQQYSSASFVSLRFLSCKEELGAHSNNPTVFSFTFFFKLREPEIAQFGECLYGTEPVSC